MRSCGKSLEYQAGYSYQVVHLLEVRTILTLDLAIRNTDNLMTRMYLDTALAQHTIEPAAHRRIVGYENIIRVREQMEINMIGRPSCCCEISAQPMFYRQ